MSYLFVSCCMALFTSVFGIVAPSTAEGLTYDLCQTKALRLGTVGETGYIKFDNTSLVGNGLGCVLKIDACSSCQVELDPEVDTYFNFFCKTGIIHSKYCSLGCDYLNIFDMYYMNETNRYYSGLGQPNDVFSSESSNVFIMICHGGGAKDYNFKIKFITKKKLKTISGSSETSSATGMISSPFFPMGYAQNHEVYEYMLTSTANNDYIRIMFDDWHLSETSSLYFINSNIHKQYNGENSRPVIISDSNYLKFTFNTGVALTEGTSRDYIGFRASYKFYGDRSHISKPTTNCKVPSYYMTSTGGRISFSPSLPTRELYDCLWVFKTQSGYDGMMLKIIKLRSSGYLFRGENQLTIRSGLSSVSPVRSVYDMLDNIDNGIPQYSSTGFYVRLNASLSSSDSVVFTFASYKKSIGGCGSGMFRCSNDRCIDSDLMCDLFDHCGDNSDETSGCSGNTNHWDKSYQYTLTIGVIVPMVISVFLIMVICLLFVMIRRCRRARARDASGSTERLPTVSEDVSERRRRRRRRRRLGFFGNAERDLPPSYDEAIQNPPGWYLNVTFGNTVDPTLPQPPSYHEATGIDPVVANTSPHQPPGSPTSSESSQSELTVCSGNMSDTTSSSDDESGWGVCSGEGEGRRGRRSRHISSSDAESAEQQQRSATTSPNQSESVSTSVATLTESSLQTDGVDGQTETETTTTNSEQPKVLKDNETVHNRDIDKKINDDSDNMIVPTGLKPGSSNLNLNDCGEEIYSSANRTQESGQKNQCRVNTANSSANQPNHSRNPSSGSDATLEHNRKPRKKTRKSKMKKNSQSATASNGTEQDHVTDSVSNLGASYFPVTRHDLNIERCNNAGENVSDNAESLKHRGRQGDTPLTDQTVIDNIPYTSPVQHKSPEQQASNDADDGYQVVVNVDDDNVLVVYDSALDANSVRRHLGAVGEESSSATNPDGQMHNQCHRRGKGGDKHPSDPDQSSDKNQTSERSANDGSDLDISIRSVASNRNQSVNMPGNVNILPESIEQSGRHSDQISNRGSRTSFVSLGRDLEEADDIYV